MLRVARMLAQVLASAADRCCPLPRPQIQYDPVKNPGDLGPLRTTNESLTGSSPTLTLLQQRNGSSAQLFAPIPGHLLRLPVASPDVISLSVNGAPASCAAADGSTNCTFAYSASATAPPAMTAVQPSAITFASTAELADLTITGSGFGASAAAVTVTVGRANCKVTSVSDTSVACKLAAAAARAGVRQVSLLVQGAGQASGNFTVNITMAVGSGIGGSSGVVVLAATGVTLVNISGNGFETSPCDDNKVLVGGVRCGIASCSSTTITAIFPGGAAQGPAAVSVLVTDDTGVETAAASYSIDNSTVVVNATAPSVLDVAAAPAPLPASAGSVSFTLDLSTPFSSVAAAYLVPAFQLDMTAGGPAVATVSAALRAALPLANLTSTDGQNVTGISPVLRAGSYLLWVAGTSGWQVLSQQTISVAMSISSINPNQATIGGGTMMTISVSDGADAAADCCC